MINVIYRKIVSPLLYFFKGSNFIPVSKEAKNKWGFLKHQTPPVFSKHLQEYPYLKDPLGGSYDYSIWKPEEFFDTRDEGRDCDDYAQLWFFYCKENMWSPKKLSWSEYSFVSKGMPILGFLKGYQILMEDKAQPHMGHMTTIVRTRELDGDFYHLCDYWWHEERYNSVVECMQQIKKKYWYKELDYQIYDETK